MPIYEFSCEACGARFERLVDAGTASAQCPECRAERSRRVFSAPAAPLDLVKSPGGRRKQERRNASLRESTKARFKESRRRVRESRSGKGPA